MPSIDITDAERADDEAERADGRVRAQPMSPERRRAMIAEAAVPLFLEHGAALTTRQLAEHLGIAEGTVFRAFGDKDSLVRAAVQAFFARGRARLAEGLVDPSLPLEDKVRAVVRGSREWMRSVMRMLSLLDRDEVRNYFPPPADDDYRAAIAAAFAPDADRLSMPVDRLPVVLRVAGAAAGAARVSGDHGLTDDELVQFILYGIAGHPAERNDHAG